MLIPVIHGGGFALKLFKYISDKNNKFSFFKYTKGDNRNDAIETVQRLEDYLIVMTVTGSLSQLAEKRCLAMIRLNNYTNRLFLRSTRNFIIFGDSVQ